MAEVWIAHALCNESSTQTNGEEKQAKELSEETTEISENTED